VYLKKERWGEREGIKIKSWGIFKENPPRLYFNSLPKPTSFLFLKVNTLDKIGI